MSNIENFKLQFAVVRDITVAILVYLNTNQDSIEHTFLECFVTKSFYSEALTWFNHVNNTDVCLSNKQIALNDIPGLQQLTDYPRRRLHLVVILLKQYIYACKYLEKKPTIKEFQSKVILQWQIEKCALP